jgi:hypothetical protein
MLQTAVQGLNNSQHTGWSLTQEPLLKSQETQAAGEGVPSAAGYTSCITVVWFPFPSLPTTYSTASFFYKGLPWDSDWPIRNRQ